MKTFTKALTGTAAAAALAVTSVAPAQARGHDGGINAGDVIAGALIIGGIAAVASAAGNNRSDDYGYAYGRDRAGYDRDGRYGYDHGNPREAVQDCVRAAERTASRNSYGRADVTDVRDIDRTRWGYQVRGRIAVDGNGRDWRDNNWRDGGNRYGRGWNGESRGQDSGSFTCKVERGRVVDLDFSGIRGL